MAERESAPMEKEHPVRGKDQERRREPRKEGTGLPLLVDDPQIGSNHLRTKDGG